MKDTGKPNLFEFATSELSQDAFFCWLLSWANPIYEESDPSLFEISCKVVDLLVGQHVEIKTIDVKRQVNEIDILVQINNDIVIVIEDKTFTDEHSNQLERYKKTAKDDFPDKQLFFAFVKIGNQAKFKFDKIANKNYRVVIRADIFPIFESYQGDNLILIQYRDHLRKIDQSTASFANVPWQKWKEIQWEGFFMELEKQIHNINWEYVPNPQGGYMTAFWGWNSMRAFNVPKDKMYLQMDDRKLSFRIECPSRSRELRNRISEKLLQTANNRGLNEVKRPLHMGLGYTMNVAIVKYESLTGFTEDIDLMVKQIKQYEQLVRDICTEATE